MHQSTDARKRRLVIRAVVVAALFVGATAAEAAQGVLTSRKVNEEGPAADRFKGKMTLMWTQSPRSNRNKIKVLVRRNGNTRRLNKKGTRGYSGGVDDRIAIYQQINNGDSDLKRFNLKTGQRSDLAVNTNKWEWGASNSGKWVLFGRQTRRRDAVILLNAQNGNTRKIAGLRGNGLASPDQVNGDFATFTKCKAGPGCNVFRYRISTGKSHRIPRKRPSQYASSVSANGTVYFAGSGLGCGKRVALYRRRNGNTKRIAKIGQKDTFATFVAPRAGGGQSVFFEKARCGKSGGFARRNNFNIYKVNG